MSLTYDPAAMLEEYVKQAKDGRISLSGLQKKMPSARRKELGINGCKAQQAAEKLVPYLGSRLELVKQGSGTSLMMKVSLETLLFEVLGADGAAPEAVYGALKSRCAKAQCVELINKLLEEGKIRVAQLNKNYKALLLMANVQKTPEPLPKQDDSPVSESGFLKALDDLAFGSGQARVLALRKRLGWPDGSFDKTLRSLRDKCVISLHSDCIGTPTEEERNRAFVDENGCIMIDISRW